jgi:hypothetical protein
MNRGFTRVEKKNWKGKDTGTAGRATSSTEKI